MKVSAKSEYGVRAMVQLARAYGKGPVPLSYVAGKERISLDFLEQLMLILRNQGLVRSVRGVHGGYMLALEPRQISVSDVMQAMDGPFMPAQCLELTASEPGVCNLGITMLDCTTRDVWMLLQERVTETLSAVTLADLCHEQGRSLRLPYEPARLATGVASLAGS